MLKMSLSNVRDLLQALLGQRPDPEDQVGSKYVHCSKPESPSQIVNLITHGLLGFLGHSSTP